MDAAIVATLVALISAFGSVMIALLLYCLKTIDTRFTTQDGRITENMEKINCVDRKVVKLGVMFGVVHPDKIFDHDSPLKIRENEIVTEVIERYMKEGDGRDDG